MHETRSQRAVAKWRLTAAWLRASLLKTINTALIAFPPDVHDVLVHVPGFNCVSSPRLVSFQIFLFYYWVPENSLFVLRLKASGYISGAFLDHGLPHKQSNLRGRSQHLAEGVATSSTSGFYLDDLQTPFWCLGSTRKKWHGFGPY